MLPSLYAIVDPLATGIDPVQLGEALLAGGARCLQLRLKDAAPDAILRVARALRRSTVTHDALLIINDRPDIAQAVDADGVHLGQDDVPVAVARRLLGPRRLVGVSTHDVSQAIAAAAAGADYLGVGPMFATASKVGALPPRGPALLQDIRRAVTLPLVAIGGITAETAPALRRQGADSVAMIAALVTAPDITAAVRETLRRLA